MKLEKWALIAEIVSGVAVLVTLVILALGVQDNTNVTRAAVYEDLMADINQFNLTLVNDKELSALWISNNDIEDLDDAEASRLILLNRVIYRIYEAAYFSYRNGSLGLSQWARFEETICNVRRRSSPLLWSNTVRILTSEFQSFIEGNCGDRL